MYWFWYLFQITVTIITGWQVFNASGGSLEYAIAVSLFMFVLAWMLGFLSDINDRLRQILEKVIVETEE